MGVALGSRTSTVMFLEAEVITGSPLSRTVTLNKYVPACVGLKVTTGLVVLDRLTSGPDTRVHWNEIWSLSKSKEGLALRVTNAPNVAVK